MKQEIQRFSIRSFYDGYKETADDVVACGGKHVICPNCGERVSARQK